MPPPLRVGEHSLEPDADGNLRLNYRPSRRLNGLVFLPLVAVATYLILKNSGETLSTIAFVLMAIIFFALPGFSYFCPELILSREGFAFLTSDRFTPYDQIKSIQVKSQLLRHTVFIETTKSSHVAAAFFSRKDANKFEKILEELIKNGGPN